MQKLNILNSKEVKRMKLLLEQEFGYYLQENYVYLQNEKNKVFLVNRDLERVDLSKLRIDRLGLYFAELKDTQLRLSKEGAQLLVKEAKKNKKKLNHLVSLTKEEVKEYFTGAELIKELGTESKLIILEYEDNVLGCAKYKEGKIINFLPKIHRGEVIL